MGPGNSRLTVASKGQGAKQGCSGPESGIAVREVTPTLNARGPGRDREQLQSRAQCPWRSGARGHQLPPTRGCRREAPSAWGRAGVRGQWGSELGRGSGTWVTEKSGVEGGAGHVPWRGEERPWGSRPHPLHGEATLQLSDTAV